MEGIDEKYFKNLNITNVKKQGKVITMILRGNEKDVIKEIEKTKPIYYELIPLTLEEIFISETEEAGYDVKKLIV